MILCWLRFVSGSGVVYLGEVSMGAGRNEYSADVGRSVLCISIRFYCLVLWLSSSIHLLIFLSRSSVIC